MSEITGFRLRIAGSALRNELNVKIGEAKQSTILVSSISEDRVARWHKLAVMINPEDEYLLTPQEYDKVFE